MLDTLKRATDEALAEIAEEMKVRRTNELFLLFSMGSQFDHLIKQALEKLGVFCLVADPRTVTAEDVRRLEPIGIIVSGGPASVHSEPPPFDEAIFDLGIPVLGICLGFQMWAKHIGLAVIPAGKREFGVHRASRTRVSSPLFADCLSEFPVLESHGDHVLVREHGDPAELRATAGTDNAPLAAAEYRNLYGVQFHPECTETEFGLQIFENFCFDICGAQDRFPSQDIARRKIQELREQIGDKRVLLALSGGSDSATVAYLLKQAVGEHSEQIRAVYIKGIDRPEDEAHVRQFFGAESWLDLKIVDATEAFLWVLAGKTSMAEKRKAMRGVYRQVLEDEANVYGASFIAQGTLYTDISESGGGYASGARKAVIKIHHNTNLNFSIPELTPLADCVKDGGRNIGRSIGVPEVLLTRHPFPGPGLVVRIEGEVTAEKLAIARQIDGIYIGELRGWNLYGTVWQAGATILNSRCTCTKGDDASEGWVVSCWGVYSVNGFTARPARFPPDFEEHVADRVTNEIREVGCVVFRKSGKPPATIEWG